MTIKVGEKMLEKLSIVVPCYNEEKSIIPFYQELMFNIKDIENITYELIFVNDGSVDYSWKIIKQISNDDANIKAINLSRNFGKEAAMLAGLSHTAGDYVVVMDCDLQHPPSILPKMLDFIRVKGYDAVGAYRNGRDKGIRTLYAKLFYRFINKMSDIKIKQNATDFRMMKRKVVSALYHYQSLIVFLKVYLRVGFKTAYIGYDDVNASKEKALGIFKLLNYAQGITSFQLCP